ncbi:MAG: thiamine pyrophosphate-binding protein [Clostridium sp.]|nr:thiamine pyrophosphate-binding protein [Clostridium sp.]
MVKVSDYIIQFLENIGVKHVFMFTGGMTMHINDSIGYSKSIKPVFMLHEQGCTFAAESYARITNNIGVIVATCGPGATNTLTGIACSWIESTPLLVITGQCKRADIAPDPNLRQYGVQEVRIVDIARPITKYAKLINDPQSIRYELEKAVFLCKDGRPGPVLLDIPVDVQASIIDESTLVGFNEITLKPSVSQSQIDQVIELIKKSKRPVIYGGYGIAIAKARSEFRKLVDKIGAPVLVHWNCIDLLEESHPLYAGRPGAVGQRAANFTLQNADLLITIGTRLSLLQTGYNFDGFAKNAKLIMVDIDEAELNKNNIHPYIKVHADAGDFINALNNALDIDNSIYEDWVKQSQQWRKEFPIIKEEWKNDKVFVNSYLLIECISKHMQVDDVFVGGRAGTCVDATIQAFKVKKGQEVYITKGLSSMGNGIPAAIGGAYATGKRIVCVVGDGGFVMNSQELEVIRRGNLPIKIFVLDNKGYSTIRNTQTNVFDGHLVGCSPESGLTIGSIKKISEAYGLSTLTIRNAYELDYIVNKSMCSHDPCVIIVNVSPTQLIEPRQASARDSEGNMFSRPLEDMKPLLPREKLEEIMSVSKTDK